MLGVAVHPRLDEAKPTEYGGLWWEAAVTRTAASCSTNGWNCPKFSAQQPARRVTPDPATPTVLPAGSSRRARPVRGPTSPDGSVEPTARRWGSAYEHGMHAVFWCINTSHSGERAPRSVPVRIHAPLAPVGTRRPGNLADLVRPGKPGLEPLRHPGAFRSESLESARRCTRPMAVRA
jgi:hypothetical protein